MSPPLIWLERVESTLDEIHRLARSGAPHGSAVAAREQTRGRGARGHAWHSPRGGLWLSVLLRPSGGVVTEVLGLRVALAVCAVLDEVLDRLELRVKWPNDLVLGDRKLGGVICEARWQGDQAAEVAVGVGLNVANPLPPELRASATTLAEWRSGVSPQLLIEPLALAISRLDPGLGVLPPAELESLQRRDWLRGRRLREPEIGVALGIESDGALRVGREDGQIALLRSGHVVLEDAGPRRP